MSHHNVLRASLGVPKPVSFTKVVVRDEMSLSDLWLVFKINSSHHDLTFVVSVVVAASVVIGVYLVEHIYMK